MKRAILAAAIFGFTAFQAAKATVINFDDPAYPTAPAGVTFSFPGTDVVMGNASNDFLAPLYADGTQDMTHFLAVRGATSATISFSTPQDSLTLLWGSIDPGNVIQFSLGGVVQGTVTGNAYNPGGAATGSQPGANQTVTVSTFTFDSITLSSVFNSFESDNLTTVAVPEPSTWAATLGAGALLTGILRRRRAGIA